MRTIGTKFHIKGDQIVKTSTGEVVPESEPLMLLRGRDRQALPALHAYLHLCKLTGCTDYQLDSVRERIAAFEEYASDDSRMKQPGSTRGAVWTGGE